MYHDTDDRFDPLDEDLVDDSSVDLLPCPSCGRALYDDTDQCPHCGDWVVPLGHAAGRRHWIWFAAALLVILGILVAVVG